MGDVCEFLKHTCLSRPTPTTAPTTLPVSKASTATNAVSLSQAKEEVYGMLANNELADMVCKSVSENACALPTLPPDVLTGILTGLPVPASTTGLPVSASTTTKPKSDDTWLLLLGLGIALAVFMKMRSGPE